MKQTLDYTINSSIREHIQWGFTDTRQNVGDLTSDLKLDNDKESLRTVWWTVRNSVCLPIRSSILQKLK